MALVKPKREDRVQATWLRRAFASVFDKLPPRIQILVDAEFQRADILGAWIGLIVVGFFGILYAVSPKVLDDMADFSPVPITVSLFILVNLFRLWKAYRGPLTRLAQTGFIVTDIALLYILIWSFHIQYAQPAAFYLKAPTFLLVFLLIAIRTLRFEPAAVLTTGIVAAIGWGLMTAYAVYATPQPAITRDFIEYMTGSVVLVGAEVEKIVAILLATFVLTIAIILGRQSLVQAVRGATARDDLARFFAPEIADRITAQAEVLKPGFGEVRSGAILVSDIRGFTVFAAQRRASEVVGVLVDYQRRMAPIIKRHGGVIDKFLGDGILSTFGCATITQAPCADALRALVDLQEEARAFSRAMMEKGIALEIGFAVVGGDVLCGTVGDEARLEFTVIGEAVNRAVKLEKYNKTLGTAALVEAATVESARGQGFSAALEDAIANEVDLSDGVGLRAVLGWRNGAVR